MANGLACGERVQDVDRLHREERVAAGSLVTAVNATEHNRPGWPAASFIGQKMLTAGCACCRWLLLLLATEGAS